MEWLTKLLESQGMSADQIKVIVEGVEGNYKTHVPKHRFDEVNAAKKQAEDSLKDRDTQLADLKKSTGDNVELQKKIEQLESDNKSAAEKYDADLKELRTNTALKLALSGEVHDPDIVTGLLDRTKIELDENGSVKAGLDDQVKALRESKAFLFVEKQTTQGQNQFRGARPPEGGGGSGGSGQGQPKSLADAVAAHFNHNQN
ncbi:MAG: phage scaffolding protein [Candidatus Pristimantibacillus sp.]